MRSYLIIVVELETVAVVSPISMSFRNDLKTFKEFNWYYK